MKYERELTRDVGGGLEGCSHLRVELDAVVHDELGVALLPLLLDPGLEVVTDLGEEHVDDELKQKG